MATTQGQSSSGFGIASLVLGILSFLLGSIGVGLVLGILALVFGIIAIRRRAGKGMAIAGVVTGGLGILASLIFLIVLSALPVLQASQRDTARKNDVATAVSSIVSYQSENKGALPTDEEVTSTAFAATFFAGFTQKVVVGEEPSKDTLVFEAGRNCPEEGDRESARSYNFQTKLENGTVYCQSN